MLNCSNSKSSIWRKRNGRKPLTPIQNAKLTQNNNYSINVILFAVMLANIVLVLWQSLNYLNQCYIIFRLQANKGRPLWSPDTSSKMEFWVKCQSAMSGQNFNHSNWSVRIFEEMSRKAASFNAIPRQVSLGSTPKFILSVCNSIVDSCRQRDPDFKK